MTGGEGLGGANLHLLRFNAFIDDDGVRLGNLHLSHTHTLQNNSQNRTATPDRRTSRSLLRVGDNDVLDWCELRFRSRFDVKAGDTSAMRAEI